VRKCYCGQLDEAWVIALRPQMLFAWQHDVQQSSAEL
jgi:hypothetical protein